MLSDRDPEELSKITDLLSLQDPTRRGDVGMRDVDGMSFEEGEKILSQV